MSTRKNKTRTNNKNKKNPSAMIMTPGRGVPSYPGCSASNPGRAQLRSVIEVSAGSHHVFMSFLDFNVWFGQARAVLTPYTWFRVADATVECVVEGGAASENSIAFNISDAPNADTSFGGVMNDDYSALCTAMMKPVLHPPKNYWRGNGVKWCRAADDAFYTAIERTAGCISFHASPAEDPGVKGHAIITLLLEFHTLE